jgi:SAM-dependent methyltransferase
MIKNILEPSSFCTCQKCSEHRLDYIKNHDPFFFLENLDYINDLNKDWEKCLQTCTQKFFRYEGFNPNLEVKLSVFNFSIIHGLGLSSHDTLEVGCGVSWIAGYYEPEKYTGVDIFSPAIDYSRMIYPKHDFICGDINSIEFEKKYEYVIVKNMDIDNKCFEVLKALCNNKIIKMPNKISSTDFSVYDVKQNEYKQYNSEKDNLEDVIL